MCSCSEEVAFGWVWGEGGMAPLRRLYTSVTRASEERVLSASCAAAPHLGALGRSCWCFPSNNSVLKVCIHTVFGHIQGRACMQ